MGTPQILLIILSVIIVAVALAVGMQHFENESIKSARQACLSELNYFSSMAKTWWNTPLEQGGGGKPLRLTSGGHGNSNIDKLGFYIGHNYQTDRNRFSTENATYRIQNGGDYSVKFTCTGNTYSNGEPIKITFIYNMKTDSTQVNIVN